MAGTRAREVGLRWGADLARMERYEADGTVAGVGRWSREDDPLAVGTRIPLEGLSIAALVRQTGRPVEVAACYLASEALEHHQAWLCLTCAA
jgi:hypothetical protein